MRSYSVRQIVLWILALALAAIFIYAAVLKIAEPAEFARAIKYYKMVPLALVNLMAVILPWWEIFAGVAVLIPKWRKAAATILLGLGVVFAIAVLTAMVRGLDITCGCFGQHSARAGLQTLAVDLFIVVASLILLRMEKNTGGAGAESPVSLPLADAR